MFLSAMFYQVLHFRHLWALLGIVAALDLWGWQEQHRRQAGTGEAGSMNRLAARLARYVPPVLTANVAARIVALIALTAATILVAHAGGPKLLGELTLLRVLPGLVGVLVSCGLPSAAPYFLASREYATLPRLRSTLFALTLAGALAASACWLILSPVLHSALLPPVAHGRRARRRRPGVFPVLGGRRQSLPARRERHARANWPSAPRKPRSCRCTWRCCPSCTAPPCS